MPPITINARKFDGRIHRTWQAELIESDGELLVFEGVFDKTITHSDLGVIRPGTVSIEYYWLSRHFNVFRFIEPEGHLKCFYCNVNLPPVFNDGVLDYVDLDIDVLYVPGVDPKVLDELEFTRNAERYGYGDEVISIAKGGLQEVLEMIDLGHFPFSRTMRPETAS